jgi:hypothetical protein
VNQVSRTSHQAVQVFAQGACLRQKAQKVAECLQRKTGEVNLIVRATAWSMQTKMKWAGASANVEVQVLQPTHREDEVSSW